MKCVESIFNLQSRIKITDMQKFSYISAARIEMDPEPNVQQAPVITTYHIGVGAGVKMFTLWVERQQNSTANTRGFYSFRYIRNLATDFEEAVAKAVQLTGVERSELAIDEDSTNPIVYGDDVLRFGKYQNHKISEMEDVKYLSWLAKGANVQKQNERTGELFWASILDHKTEKFKYFAQDRLIALGEWINYKGRNMSKALATKIETRDSFIEKAQRGHHYTKGERVKGVTLHLIRVSSFEVRGFGYGGPALMYIASFITDDGKLVKYKGSSVWWTRHSKMMDVAFTVDHTEYKGENETMIKRPKVGKTAPYEPGEIDPMLL